MDDYNQFSENPGKYLATLLQFPPSRQAAGRLAGNVAASFKESVDPQTAALYLQTAARHLPATVTPIAAGGNNAAMSPSNSKADLEAEMKNTQMVFEIVEVRRRAPHGTVRMHDERWRLMLEISPYGMTLSSFFLLSNLSFPPTGSRTRRDTLSTSFVDCTIGHFTRLG